VLHTGLKFLGSVEWEKLLFIGLVFNVGKYLLLIGVKKGIMLVHCLKKNGNVICLWQSGEETGDMK
jgi:hypothetical protein